MTPPSAGSQNSPNSHPSRLINKTKQGRENQKGLLLVMYLHGLLGVISAVNMACEYTLDAEDGSQTQYERVGS